MSHYILYPIAKSAPVKVVKRRPSRPAKGYGFAEGPFYLVRDVIGRLNQMNIPNIRRPERFKYR